MDENETNEGMEVTKLNSKRVGLDIVVVIDKSGRLINSLSYF